MGRRAARSVAVAGPAWASVARMARRVGSARAVKTCSATASVSGGIEVGGQLAQLLCPAFGVPAVGLAVGVLRQLREPGLDHRQPGARADGFECELDIGTARIVLRQPVDAPGEPEYPWLLHPFHAHL